MPIFDYHCSLCHHADIEYSKMGGADPVMECPECGEMAYTKQISLSHTDMKKYQTPIEMYSVACNSEEEIREIQRKCPDVQISDNPDDEMYGIPIASSRSEKKQILKAVGFQERN